MHERSKIWRCTSVKNSECQQHGCSLCSREAAAPCPPTQLLFVFQGSSCSIMLHWSRCICSQRAAAPCAPAELLSLLLGSRCSSGAAPCAPVKHREQHVFHERATLLYVLPVPAELRSVLSESCCFLSSRERRRELLHVFQLNYSLCSQKAAASLLHNCNARFRGSLALLVCTVYAMYCREAFCLQQYGRPIYECATIDTTCLVF